MTDATVPSSTPPFHPNNTFSLTDLSSLFISFFKTESSPEGHGRCAKYLFGCLEKMRGHEGWRAELQEKNHDFWKSLITFVSTPRSYEEIDSLAESLSDCHCEMDDGITKHLHEVELSETLTADPSPFLALISKLLETLHECLFDVDYIQLCSGTIHNPLPLWPTVTSDLLPFGGETAVVSFLQWADKFNLPVAHAALCRVLMCTRSLVRPYLLEDEDFRPSLLECFDPINQPTSDMLTLQQKKKVADFLDDVLECFMTTVDIHGEDGVIQWIGKDAPKFITLCNNALDVTFPKSEFAKSNFTDGPASAFATLVLQLRHSPSMMQAIMQAIISTLWPSTPMHEEVEKLVRRAMPGGTPELHYFTALCKIHAYRAGRQECSALGCGRKAETMTETALRLCSGCRCVVYCSEECQMAEWRSSMLPHRKVCMTFRVFTPYVDGLKDGTIRKTAKKCLQDGVLKIEAMNADFLLRLMDKHRDRFLC